MTLSGHTIPFAVLGHPIGHTLSPIMHNESIRSLGMDAIYLAFDVHPDKLMTVLPAMRGMGFGGVNLTVPLKETAFDGINDLAPSAVQTGAVNTVEFLEDGALRGHNTDGYGFLEAIRVAFGSDVKDASVFVIGSGGAGRAIAITCAAEGAGRITVTDIDIQRARRVAAEIRETAPSVEIETAENAPGAWKEAALSADLIVQATPVGMKPDDPPIAGPELFRPEQAAFDLVYMYPETPFMKTAREQGAAAANGLDMLLYQGARAFTIWTGRQPDTSAMRKALQRAVYGEGS